MRREYYLIENVGESGGRTWARTKDPLIKSQLLYQLSYASMTGLSDGALERRRPRREEAN
jgi:hypothetical protein